MISVSKRIFLADLGLNQNEMMLGVTPSAKHHSLLASYLLNLRRGPPAVRNMILADLRSFLDLGAQQRAADLFVVLRLFLSDHPEAMLIECPQERRDRRGTRCERTKRISARAKSPPNCTVRLRAWIR